MEFYFYKICAILIGSSTLFLAYFSKRIVGIWLNPGSIFSLFWGVYILVPLTVVWDVPINPFSILYIIIFILLFIIPASLFNWKAAIKMNANKNEISIFSSRYFFYIFISFSTLSLLGCIMGMKIQGIPFSLNIIKLAGAYASKRYAGELTSTFYSQIGIFMAYPTAIVGGLIWNMSHGAKKQGILLISFAPSIFVMLMQSSKGMLFLALSLFIGAILVGKIYKNEFNIFNIKTFRYWLIYFLLLLPLVVTSFFSRGLHSIKDKHILINKLLKYILSYSSGHLYAFSDWFSDRYFNDGLFDYVQQEFEMGFYTFMSIFRLFGEHRAIPMGIYEEQFHHGYFIKTNIYTAFRGLVVDFTLIGSLIFSLVLGYIINLSFFLLLKSTKNIISISFFIFFCGFCYQSYIISIFTWTSITANIFFICFVLFFVINYDSFFLLETLKTPLLNNSREK